MLEIAEHGELLDALGCGIWVYDGTNILYVNHALEEMTGYAREELLAPEFFSDLIHPDDREMIVERGRARIRGESVPEKYEISVIANGGERTYLSLHARPMILDTSRVSVVSAVDVTALRKAEAVIREGSMQLTALLDAVPAHIIATDPAGKPTFVNRHWLEFTGQTREEAMRNGTARLMHTDDRAAAGSAWRSALKAREPYEIEYRIRDRNGDFRWQMFRIRPVKNADGMFYGWTSVSVDVHETRQLRSELERTVQELADAIDAKDEIFGLISHELRTPLTTLLGNATYLVRHGTEIEPDAMGPIARDLESDANRLYTVIENMLVLSRTRNGEHEIETEPARLNRLVETTVRNFVDRHPDRKVSFVAPEGVSLVEVNHGYYDQILSNLLSNAHKYSPLSSPISVELRELPDAVQTAVTDCGPGIPAEQLEEIFAPFVRLNTRSGISGVGLGLTLCRRLVELHGGEINVRNRPGGGAEFSFTLPKTVFAED